jgi:predicted MPP superfamily phosphohydrolase
VALAANGVGREEAALVYGRSSATIAAAKGTGERLLVIASHTPPDRRRLAAGRALGGGEHLYIAGHTHGGQVRLPLIGAIAAPLSWPAEERDPARGNEITVFPELRGRFVDGMYVRDGQRIFVSRGMDANTGFIRFLSRAEIVSFNFVPASAE